MDSEGIRNNNFTFIRLVAASSVVVYHSFKVRGINYDPLSRFIGFDTLGFFAVAAFFAVSGFLVTGSLMRSTPLDYLKKRVLRMYPAYLVLTVLTILVLGPFVSTLGVQGYFLALHPWSLIKTLSLYYWNLELPGVFAGIPRDSIFRSINNPLWTLPVEFLAYLALLLISLIGWLKPRGVAVVVLLTGAVFFTTSFIGLEHTYMINGILLRLSKFFVFFFMGALIYSMRGSLKFSYVYFIIACAVLLTGRLMGSITEPGSISHLQQLIYFLAWPYIVICFAYLPIPHVNRLDELGDISYGTYLYAYPLQQYIVTMSGPDIGSLKMILYSLAVSMSFGTLSWLLVERPVLRHKDVNIRASIRGLFKKKVSAPVVADSSQKQEGPTYP